MNMIRRLITLTSNRTLGASITRPPFTHSLIRSFTHFSRSLIHSFTHSLIHSFTHCSRSLIHSFTHSLIHSFTHCLCLCFALLLVSSVSAQDVPTRRGSRIVDDTTKQ